MLFMTTSPEFDEIATKHDKLVSGFASGITKSLNNRKDQLRKLYYAIADNEAALKAALVKDLGRSPIETEILELHLVYSEIQTAIANVEKWAADQSLWGDIRLAAARPKLQKAPYGAVLIFGPWNYPIVSTIIPLASALAAGNTVLLKPSEMTPHTTGLLCSLLGRALNPSIFQSVQGAVPEATFLLSLKWDKIMVTGSCGVGKIVAAAAAKHLTPVALELGGKSPVIVTKNADLAIAAKRIAWGKFINAGQTCIAPDYVVIDKQVEEQFIVEFGKAVQKMYRNLDHTSPDFAHIVSDRLWQRMTDLVAQTNGRVVFQHGVPDRASKFFPPTLVAGVSLDDVLMSDEIFGPILPIIAVQNAARAAPGMVRQNDHPLALYIFTKNKSEATQLIGATRSGAVLVNDVVLHGGSPTVPFGGVGASGSGRYHGRYGFDEFTHERPVLQQPLMMEKLLKTRYPPYSTNKLAKIRRLGRRAPTFHREGFIKDSLLKQMLDSRLFWLAMLVGGELYAFSPRL